MTEDTEPNLAQRLRVAREQKGWALEKAANQLNLNVSQLAKYEDPQIDFSQLDAFERGYLRNYVLLLDIDSEHLDRALGKDQAISSELQPTAAYNEYGEKEAMISGRGLGRLLLLLFILVVGYLIYLAWPGVNEVSQITEEALKLTLPNESDTQLQAPKE